VVRRRRGRWVATAALGRTDGWAGSPEAAREKARRRGGPLGTETGDRRMETHGASCR
jgi:hypothetical protein